MLAYVFARALPQLQTTDDKFILLRDATAHFLQVVRRIVRRISACFLERCPFSVPTRAIQAVLILVLVLLQIYKVRVSPVSTCLRQSECMSNICTDMFPIAGFVEPLLLLSHP